MAKRTLCIDQLFPEIRSKNTPAVKYCRRGIFYERGITTEIKPALFPETAFPDS